MLLQSHLKTEDSQILQLLPALPDAWPTGEVKGLRARGGFVVDMKWKDGVMVSCKLKSLLGNSAEMKYKNKIVKIESVVNKTYEINF
jgi:alpha-L-fucosidase 2